jgi:hypothetical protein
MNQTAQSYLLRLWREHATAPVRATLIAVAQPEAPPQYAFLGDLTGETSGTSDDLNDTYCTSPETD